MSGYLGIRRSSNAGQLQLKILPMLVTLFALPAGFFACCKLKNQQPKTKEKQ